MILSLMTIIQPIIFPSAPFDIFGLTSHYLGTCQGVETLLHSLMVMSNPHYLDMSTEDDQIYFPL